MDSNGCIMAGWWSLSLSLNSLVARMNVWLVVICCSLTFVPDFISQALQQNLPFWAFHGCRWAEELSLNKLVA